jgi:Flp pilus assembly protein protease CpaA
VKKTQRFLIWSILTLATVFDARSYTIPNQLIVLGYLAGFVTSLTSQGIKGIAHFLLMAIWPIGLLMLLYICGKSMGAGDIKLFSVMATLVGVSATVKTFVLSVILAGITIIAISTYEGRLLRRKLHYSYYMAAAFFCLQCI